jgi:hypothetical protein
LPQSQPEKRGRHRDASSAQGIGQGLGLTTRQADSLIDAGRELCQSEIGFPK